MTPFSLDAIREAVQTHLQQDVTIPEGHRGALVSFVNTNRVELIAAAKIGDHWTVEVKGHHNWTGGLEFGAISKVTW